MKEFRKPWLRRISLLAGMACLCLVQSCVSVESPGPLTEKAADEWTPIFNGRDLKGWYTFLPSTGRNNDPKGVFKVHENMIHILDIPVTGEREEFGYIATEKEYSDYHIRFEYKWGQKRFAPRAEAKRDSGILYHFVGPDKVWPRSVECPVQETDTGDFYMVGDTAVTTTVVGEDPLYYSEDGTPRTQKGGRIVKDADYEDREGWNTVEVILEGDRVTHLVNGRANNRGWDLSQPDPQDPQRMIPLTRGRLLLQAEGAEVFYRNVEVKPIKLPKPTG